MCTMDERINQVDDFQSSDTQPNKRTRKKSVVWDHFTVETVADSKRARCNQCRRSFAYISGSKPSGTSHLKRHIGSGICLSSVNNKEKSQQLPYTPTKRSKLPTNIANKPGKRVRANNEAINSCIQRENWGFHLAKMIIQHDYPLHMVEHTGFIDFTRSLRPQFDITNVGGVQEHIMCIYYREKQKIQDCLGESLGNLNLMVDLWTSNQSLVYVHLTGHFVDNDWKLRRRIFNFMTLHIPGSNMPFNRAITDCLIEWRSKDKLFTLTLDRSLVNEKAEEGLRNLLAIKNPQILNGQLLIKNCFTRTCRSLAQSALASLRAIVDKVRQSVIYIKTSAPREKMFAALRQQLQVPSTKNLRIDDLNKWNTTYEMLVAACELKEVFCCLDTEDPIYKSNVSMEEWARVEILCAYLKLFYDAANVLTSPVCPTANIFFQEVWKVHLELVHASSSPDFFLRRFTAPLMEKFTRYWDDCNIVLAIAAVMDPRFKMRLVEFTFSKIYGDDAASWVKIVDSGLHELYDEYVVQSLPLPIFVEESDPLLEIEAPHLQEDPLLSNGDGSLDFDVYISDITGGDQKSELNQYLEEPLLPRCHDFDVLGWWKANSLKYPTLSKLACDILSLPLSSLDQDSVFDGRGRKLDGRYSCLRANVLQALVCAKDWLRYDGQFETTKATATVKADI